MVIFRCISGGFETHFACFLACFLPSSTVEYAVVTADFNPDKLRIFERKIFTAEVSYMSIPTLNRFRCDGAVLEE